MARLKDKVALVTGGASGIGLATVDLFAREGATVLFSDVNRELAAAAVDSLAAKGLRTEFMYQDVSDADGWRRIADDIARRYGRLNVLVNNAGIALIGTVEEASIDDWRRTMAINLDGVFLGTQAAIALMKDGGGSIVNVSSIEGIVGEPVVAAYNASKGGVRIFTKSAALHCADRGYPIRVNSIHPGFVATPMVSGAVATMGEQAGAAFRDDVLRRIPVSRFATPEEIAYPILFLASDESRYMTGAELVVDGGMTAR
jgi:NAD(P)-dependent dehydrogenase (short-subunit alcohol dehydrogenase family)